MSINQPYNNTNNYKGSGLPKYQKFHPRFFPGDCPKLPSTIIESVDELQSIIQLKYHNDISLNNIIRLYGEYNIQFTSNIILQLSVSDVNSVCEYARAKDIYSSKKTPEQYELLLNDIKINGFRECGRIRMTRNADCNIEVILGEGNHRLSVAKQLQLNVMPIRLVYTP